MGRSDSRQFAVKQAVCHGKEQCSSLICAQSFVLRVDSLGIGKLRIILQVRDIECDAQLLTVHTPSAKGPTLNLFVSVICFGRAIFAVRSKEHKALLNID